MANTLNIVNGSTTTSLNSSDYAIVDYVPTTGNGEIVLDRIRIQVKASSYSNLQSDLRAIETAIEAAQRRYDSGIGDRVYLKFCPDGLSTTYRSEIIRPEGGTEAGRIELQPLQFGWKWRYKYAEVLILLHRRDYWEADSETELSLRNNSGSGTGGLAIINSHSSAVLTDTSIYFSQSNRLITDGNNGFTVFAVGDLISIRGSDSNDGTYTISAVAVNGSTINVNEPIADELAGNSISIYDIYNYVDIASSSITGVLPTPVRLRLTNSYNVAADLETVWIGQNWRSSPLSMVYYLETEDSATGSNTANAGASSGQYRIYDVTTTETALTTWSLSSAQMTASKGAYFRLIAKFFDGTDITKVEYRIRLLYGTDILWDSGIFSFDDTYEATDRVMREFCTMQLPPYFTESQTPPAITLQLSAVSTTGSTETIKLDYIEMLPLDGWRKLVSTSGVAYESILVDDGIDNMSYQLVASQIVNDIYAEGVPVMLVPGKDTRLYFMMHSITDDTAEIVRTASIRIYYRPRVRTI